MRIAFIVGGFPKLSETWILSQLTGLVDRGHEVDIYARRRPAEAAVHPDVEAYGLLRRTRYFDLPTTRLGRLARATLALAHSLPRRPRPILRCLDRSRYGSVYAVLNNLMFAAPFSRQRYDAILCHFGGNGMDLIALKEVFPETRFVTMFHGDDYFLPDEKGPGAFALLRQLGDAFLVTTDCFGRATLRRHGFDDGKIITHRLAIAAKQVPFRSRSLTKRTLRILSVGRLVAKKGFEFGIRAAVGLQRANPALRIEYRVIGDGPLQAELAALVDKLDAAGTVSLLGPATSVEVMGHMEDADLYLLPSLMEQAGYVLLEAQASGLPVVATRVGGVPEMVREGRSALLVEPGDAASLTQGLQRLLDQPGRWPHMGAEGRRHVEEHHDAARLNAELEAILRG